MTQRSRLASNLSGVAGEYFVAGELSRRGYLASITLRNTRGVDILASNADATRTVAIQVKANQGSNAEWVVQAKIEDDVAAENLFFVFVRLNDFGQPQYHIVPSGEAVRYAAESHREWLSQTSKSGKPHKDSSIRKFRDPDGKYLDRWDLLGLDEASR